MGTDPCFFPIFHGSTLLSIALPSPFKYARREADRSGLAFLYCALFYDNILSFRVVNSLSYHPTERKIPMICRNCKFNLQGSEKYCPNCGAPLLAEKKEITSQAEPPKAPEIFFTPVKEEEKDTPEIFRTHRENSEEQTQTGTEKKQRGSKSSSKAPVMLMLLLITAVLTVGLFVAAEKFNITPVILDYLGGAKTETDATELVYSPAEILTPSPEDGTVKPDINYTSTEARVARINLLALRKGPSDAYGLIRSLESDTQLQIMGGTAVTDSWIYVYVPSEDCYGWVNAAFVTLYSYSSSEARDYTRTNEKSVIN